MSGQDVMSVIGERYASPEMKAIWSTRGKILRGRRYWISVLRAQQALGMEVPEGAIAAYERVAEDIDLASIKKRELILKHDNLAEIEEFNARAGFECIHQGLTTRDKSDTIEQMQIHESLNLIRDRAVAVLARLCVRAKEYQEVDTSGRSHFVPAQTVTMGKRFANWADELYYSFDRFDYLADIYPFRGIKGAVGTAQDMIDRLGSAEKAEELEARLAEELGFPNVFTSVGQVYPRSLDFAVTAELLTLASPCGNFANMIRLLSGLDLAYEGSAEGQKGSSAMPHKINARSCERIISLIKILRGRVMTAADLCGDQWLEGDVSDSAARRDLFPDAFFALDGIFETTLTVLDQMEIFPAQIEQELQRHLPFLSSTRILMAAVKKGVGREIAHTAINLHAKEATKAIRNGASPFIFIDALASDEKLQLSQEEIEELMTSPNHGNAAKQVDQVRAQVLEIMQQYPDEIVYYRPAPIL